MSSALVVVISLALLLMTTQSVSASSSSDQQSASSQMQPAHVQDLMTLDDVRLLKRSAQDALQQHFMLLLEVEEDILRRIEALKAQRLAISERKRSHYMCSVNLIACYK